jgi:hypothetical protein
VTLEDRASGALEVRPQAANGVVSLCVSGDERCEGRVFRESELCVYLGAWRCVSEKFGAIDVRKMFTQNAAVPFFRSTLLVSGQTLLQSNQCAA